MKSPVIRFGVLPALVLLPLTVLRTWLEINHPDAPGMKFISVLALGFFWLFVTALMLLRGGTAFRTHAACVTVFSFLYRIPVSAVYALAWAGNWTTPDGRLCRYVEQVTVQMKMPPDVSSGRVFMQTMVFAVVHSVLGMVIWFIAWAIAFRRRSPIKAGAPVSGDRRASPR